MTYPDATNIEAGAAAYGWGRTRTGGRRGSSATDNVNGGFSVQNFNGGTLSDNTATGNFNGFAVFDFNGGTLSGNTATSNGDDGFSVFQNFNEGNTATFELNEATDNTGQGYDIEGEPQTGAGTNSGNGSHDSF